MKEIWKDVCTEYQNCELNGEYSNRIYHIRPDKYQVSNTGQIRNKYTKQILAIDSQGRTTFDVMDWRYSSYPGNKSQYGRCQFKVNRIMYLTFVGPLKSTQRVTKSMISNI